MKLRDLFNNSSAESEPDTTEHRFSYTRSVREDKKVPVYDVTICTVSGRKSFECNRFEKTDSTIEYFCVKPNVWSDHKRWYADEQRDRDELMVEVPKANLLWVESKKKGRSDIFTYEGTEERSVYVKVVGGRIVEYLDTFSGAEIDTYIN